MQKMVWNDNKFCLLHFISQEPYIMWLSFMVHIFAIIISSLVLFIFPKIWFSGCTGCKRAKNGPEWQKIVFFAPYLRNHTSYLWFSFMVKMCTMIISPGVFFNFKILIIWFVRGLKGQKMAQNNKKFCLSHLIFQEAYIMWSSIMVHMMYERIISLDIASIFFFKILIFRIIRGKEGW